MTKRIDERVAFLSTRRHVLMAGAATGAALLLPTMPRVARAADVPFTVDCDRASGFVMDPNEHKRVGYVTEFSGIGLPGPLGRDLQVAVPPGTAAPAYAGLAASASSTPGGPRGAKVVGVIERFSWAGGVGDSISVNFWCSQENASQLKKLPAQKTDIITGLGFWIGDFDQDTKVWFERAYPLSPPKLGGRMKPSGLSVDMTPTPAKAGLNLNVFKVAMEMVPAANQTSTMQFATSSKTKAPKSWGLVVGTLRKQ